MSEENIKNNSTSNDDYDDALKSVQAATDSLVAVVAVCEELRQFLSVSRLAVKKNNNDFALTLINSMIQRLDPLLQNFYKDLPDDDFIDIVMERLVSPKIWPDEAIDYVEITPDELKQFNEEQKNDNN